MFKIWLIANKKKIMNGVVCILCVYVSIIITISFCNYYCFFLTIWIFIKIFLLFLIFLAVLRYDDTKLSIHKIETQWQLCNDDRYKNWEFCIVRPYYFVNTVEQKKNHLRRSELSESILLLFWLFSIDFQTKIYLKLLIDSYKQLWKKFSFYREIVFSVL